MKRQFKGLRRKLLVSILASALLLSILAVLVSFAVTVHRNEVRTSIMLDQLLKTVESSATAAVYSKNKIIAEDVIDGLLKNDSVFSVSIVGVDGFHLEKQKESQTREYEPITRSLFFDFGEHAYLGYIAIKPSEQFVVNEARQILVTNVLFSILVIAITALTILFVVERDFSRPFKSVYIELQGIKSGEKNRLKFLQKNENDEIGYLVSEINHLLEILENKFDQEHRLRQQIESIEQQLRDIFNNTSAGVFLLDAEGKHLTSNLTLKKLLNSAVVEDENPLGEHYMFSRFFNEKKLFEALIQKTLNSDQAHSIDISLNTPDYGETIWLHCLMSKVVDAVDGQIGLQGVLFDITQRVHNELAVKYEADHDPLTGLLRRQAAQYEFDAYVQSTQKPKVSALLMDLDGFKKANDSYGHLVGDRLLAVVAERLLRCVRSTDIVCRLGGDEFLVLLLDWEYHDIKFKIAENIIESITNKINIDKHILNVGISIGIADLSHENDGFTALINAADEAMYKVKRNGKNGFCFNDSGQLTVKLVRSASEDDADAQRPG